MREAKTKRRTRRLKVLFIGSHPDDPEIGAGAAICVFLQAGFEVICVFLSRGCQGGDPEVRERESRKACRRLGVPAKNVFFGDFEDTNIQVCPEIIAFLEQFVDERVWAVFTHSEHETHQDHRRCAEACAAAYRRVPRILAYESPSCTPDFRPNAFIVIDGHLKQKWAALKCHKSQIAQARMYLQYESMVHLAAFRGQQNGVNYAEAFEVIRFCIAEPEMPPLSKRGRPWTVRGRSVLTEALIGRQGC